MARVNPRLIDLIISTVNRSDEVSKVTINSAKSESDFQSMLEARTGGGRDYTLAMTIAQDHASGTLWDLIWTGGGTEVVGVYAPYGNAAASVTQPHYTFTAIVTEPDGEMFGGESNSSTKAVAVVEVEWALKVKPVKKTA